MALVLFWPLVVAWRKIDTIVYSGAFDEHVSFICAFGQLLTKAKISQTTVVQC